MSQLLEYTKKNDKKIEKKNREKLFLAQNRLNRIMSQISDYTKTLTKIEKQKSKNYFGVRIVWNE